MIFVEHKVNSCMSLKTIKLLKRVTILFSMEMCARLGHLERKLRRFDHTRFIEEGHEMVVRVFENLHPSRGKLSRLPILWICRTSSAGNLRISAGILINE